MAKSKDTGKATASESTDGTFISGFDIITNKFKKKIDIYFTGEICVCQIKICKVEECQPRN